MSFMFNCIFSLKKMVNIQLLAILFLYALLILFAKQLLLHRELHTINIGILNLTNENDFLFEILEENNDVVDIKVYYDLKELQRDVMNNNIQTGYVLESNMPTITSYTSPFSVASSLTDLYLSSFLLEKKAGEIGYKTIAKYFPNLQKEWVIEQIQAASVTQRQQVKPMEIQTEYEYFYDTPPKGTLKVMLFLCIHLFALISFVIFMFINILTIRKKNYYETMVAMQINVRAFVVAEIVATLLVSILFFSFVQLLLLF